VPVALREDDRMVNDNNNNSKKQLIKLQAYQQFISGDINIRKSLVLSANVTTPIFVPICLSELISLCLFEFPMGYLNEITDGVHLN
jgi:hypothetical protein